MKEELKAFNDYWTSIYYHLHYSYEGKITHQGIRILQHIQKQESIGINEVASYMSISQNTASEHIKRMIEKGWVQKIRKSNDERKVALSLTKKGSVILHRNTSLDEKKLESLFNSMKSEEKQMVVAAFKLMNDCVKQCT